MIRYSFSILCILLLPLFVFGQSGQGSDSQGDILKVLTDVENEDQVYVEVDSLLVANYYKLITQNSKIRGIPGYRIRIFSESGLGAKEQQQQMRARFLSEFPEIDAYHKYDEPFFKVYVGDCRTKSEVLKLYDKIKKKFPNPIIVPDYINESSAD
jgi:hypothetical protein